MCGGGSKVSAETKTVPDRMTVIPSKFDIRYLLQYFFFFSSKTFCQHDEVWIHHLLCWDVRRNHTEALRGQSEREKKKM